MYITINVYVLDEGSEDSESASDIEVELDTDIKDLAPPAILRKTGKRRMSETFEYRLERLMEYLDYDHFHDIEKYMDWGLHLSVWEMLVYLKYEDYFVKRMLVTEVAGNLRVKKDDSFHPALTGMLFYFLKFSSIFNNVYTNMYLYIYRNWIFYSI